MENKETGRSEDEKGGGACCGKSRCGCKALAAVALLAIGGLGGYFASRHCTAAHAAAAPVSSPAK